MHCSGYQLHSSCSESCTDSKYVCCCCERVDWLDKVDARKLTCTTANTLSSARYINSLTREWWDCHMTQLAALEQQLEWCCRRCRHVLALVVRTIHCIVEHSFASQYIFIEFWIFLSASVLPLVLHRLCVCAASRSRRVFPGVLSCLWSCHACRHRTPCILQTT